LARKERFLFQKFTILSSTFDVEPDVVFDIIEYNSLLFINESNAIVEISFDGTNVHGELNSTLGIKSLLVNYSNINKIWFRLVAGVSATILIQNDASIYNFAQSTGGGGSGDGYTSTDPFDFPFPENGTASGFNDGSNMQSARVFDANTGVGNEYVIGSMLRASASGGSVETGTSSNPLRVDPTGTTKQPIQLFDSNNTPVKATLSQELKVAQLYTFADLTSKYELDSRYWDIKTSTGGAATHEAAESAIKVEVTSASGSTSEIRTNTYYKYQSSYTQLVDMSIINSDTGQVNQVREWGYFDDQDGLFFRLSGTTFSIVERSSTSGAPVETTYNQSAWNIDPLNGSGPSGITLDLSKGNIFQIELQWFGVGTTRYSVDGVLVHEVKHANTLTAPYMKTATLPIQVRVTNTAASSAGSVKLICARVAAQGQQQEPFEWIHAIDSSVPKLVGLTEIPVLSIRPKATFNGVTNRMLILPKLLSASTEGYKISFKLIYGATLTGSSWNSVNSKSGVEYDESATSYSGGELIYHGFIPEDSGHQDIDISKFFNIQGRIIRTAGFSGTGTNVADTLTVVAVNEAVGRTNVEADLTWSEIR
jgi:hypothetical protein